MTEAPYYTDEQVTLLLGDALDVLRTMPDTSVDCIVTSPPYWNLRDYGATGQIGQETTPAEYVTAVAAVFSEARRVLASDGTCWVNIDDSYAYPPGSAGAQGRGQRQGRRFTAEGLPGTRSVLPKNLCLIPERLSIALQDDGWIIRNRAVWRVTNSMPESAQDRLSHRYETVFLLSKSARYHFDLDAIREPYSETSVAHAEKYGSRYDRVYGAPGDSRHGKDGSTLRQAGHHPQGRSPGDVWDIATRPNKTGQKVHFATFPIDLPIRCIKAGCRPGGTVLDPFSGSGTTGAAARQLGRRYVGIDLNSAYHDLARQRFAQGVLDIA